MPTRAQLRRWVRAALAHSAQITLRIVDAAEAQALNKKFRRKDYATNVLSFVYHAPMLKPSGTGKRDSAAADRPPLSGDIVLCAPVIEREAREQGKTLTARYAHLTVHGVLHLQGYDHLRVHDAKVMEQIETETLAALGYPDPYQSPTGVPHA